MMSQMSKKGLLKRIDSPVAVWMRFHMGQAAKRAAGRLKNDPRPVKPDIDNMVKYYLDVMNETLFTDDRLVTELFCQKIFSIEQKTEIFVCLDNSHKKKHWERWIHEV